MRKYEAKPTCDKCGGDNIERDYHDEDAHYIPCCTDVGTEHLSLSCEDCGYRWYTATKDADATPEGKVLTTSNDGSIERMVAAADAFLKGSPSATHKQQVTHDIGAPPEQQGVITSTEGDDYAVINANDTTLAWGSAMQVASNRHCLVSWGYDEGGCPCRRDKRCTLFSDGNRNSERAIGCIEYFGKAGVWMVGKKDTE